MTFIYRFFCQKWLQLSSALLLYAISAQAQLLVPPPDSITPAAPLPVAKPFLIAPAESEAAAIIEGKILDEAGKPVYAFVVIAGTKWAVWTNKAGNYRLPVPATCIIRRRKVKVIVGMIGYLPQRLTFDVRLPIQPVIQLRQDTRPLY